jgi:conjugal transfer pilus assembly protein TraU
MAYKLHRQGKSWKPGADVAVCYEYPSPIIPKERWRYQMVNMYPDSGSATPRRTVMRWKPGKSTQHPKELRLSDVA